MSIFFFTIYIQDKFIFSLKFYGDIANFHSNHKPLRFPRDVFLFCISLKI